MSRSKALGILFLTVVVTSAASIALGDGPKGAGDSITWSTDLKRAAASVKKENKLVLVWITVEQQEWKSIDKFNRAWSMPKGECKVVTLPYTKESLPGVSCIETHGSRDGKEVWFGMAYSNKKKGGDLWFTWEMKDGLSELQVQGSTFGLPEGFIIAYQPSDGWVTNSDQALDAKELPFTSDGKGGWTRKPQESVWADPSVVKAVNGDAVAVRLGLVQAAPLAKKYSVTAIPTLLFLAQDGTLLDRHDGVLKGAGDVTDALEKAKKAAGAGGGGK